MALLRIGQAVRAIGLEEAKGAGLTPVQAQTLLFVHRTKSFAATIGRLARHLGASHASAVGVVDALSARGLLYREPSPDDRRITLLRLTASGRETCTQLDRWGHQLSNALAGLRDDERAALERGLGAVIASLRAAGYLDVAEPCRGCLHFRENVAPDAAEPHRCALIDRYLSEEEALKYCPDHTPLTLPQA